MGDFKISIRVRGSQIKGVVVKKKAGFLLLSFVWMYFRSGVTSTSVITNRPRLPLTYVLAWIQNIQGSLTKLDPEVTVDMLLEG